MRKSIWHLLSWQSFMSWDGFMVILKKEHFRKFKQEFYLIDFEKTRLISSPDPITDATPRYMAPELFHGANKTVQSDLYALGIVLYEWLTQTRLQANSYHEWAVLHCQN